MTYSFGMPGPVIWTFHIIIGLTLLYIGYQIYNDQPINKNFGILLMVLGALAPLYHAYLFYYYTWGAGKTSS
jgi:hypothetical protein